MSCSAVFRPRSIGSVPPQKTTRSGSSWTSSYCRSTASSPSLYRSNIGTVWIIARSICQILGGPGLCVVRVIAFPVHCPEQTEEEVLSQSTLGLDDVVLPHVMQVDNIVENHLTVPHGVRPPLG